MERLTREAQIGPFASLKDKAEAKPRAFNDYDCFLAHARAVTALKVYEDICFDEDGKERITIEQLSALVKARDEGRMVVLPVPKGTTIYRVIHYPEHKCQGQMKGRTVAASTRIHKGVMQWDDAPNWGKTVFLTRAEAETAMGGGGDG